MGGKGGEEKREGEKRREEVMGWFYSSKVSVNCGLGLGSGPWRREEKRWSN